MVHPGQSFAGYVVENVLGHGGEAVVYLARGADRTRGLVALKVLERPDHAAIARLAREYRITHRLRHRHIVAVYDHGEHWMTMQYVDGGNAIGLPSPDAKLDALAQIAAALDYAHHDGIVHGDVKPANILVHQDFSRHGAVLIDFGVAHVLAEDVWHRPGQVVASLPYAAPELLQGRLPQAATDEYALACTAAELLTGATPFTADDPLALVDAHLHLPPPEMSRQIPWLSRSFDKVLTRAIAKDPDLRYPSCTELVQHITEAVRRSAQNT
ncbi:serine/threonine-protein kinase [Mycobacterium sp. CVI_P3]|uniref:non-specific serine/threonine protein kinase n=1 Tax=Mycobacterium pinniadriaticum TaxID=2994102 RepID=A0ABT3SDQ6_9MYCO|nr:serine/threonine-protein kinase [Mycobacterium pinniadriaticum]MCX2931135.1 serine/threonine-protein kinase [Mycobacterium pinniadriaticum]MCX2937641.1 serine/threonine-protein kinase [Mycobacterium pinniadriaticum]